MAKRRALTLCIALLATLVTLFPSLFIREAAATPPTLRWSYPTGDYVISTPVVADVDGDGEQEVVVGSWDYKLYCLNGAGGLKWSYTTEGLVQSRPAVADVDGDGQQEVITASEDTRTYCLDGKTGGLEWSYASGGGMHTPVVADINGDGKLEIVVGSGDHNLYCLNGSGVEMWSYATGGAGSYPTIADVNTDGKLEVVVGSLTGKVYCLNSTGGFLWSYQAGAGISSSPTVSDVDLDGKQEIVVGSWDHKIHCLNSTGALKWNYATNGPVYVDTNIADVDGDGRKEVLAGSIDKTVYCLNETGGLKWSYVTLGKVECMPAVADTDEDGQLEVIFGSFDHSIYCLNGTGGLEWDFATLDFVEAYHGPAMTDVDRDGHPEVIIGSGDRKVYCLQAPQVSETIPPAAITDLATSSPTDNSVTLTWTAPGDNEATGTTAGYSVKYSTSGPITDDNWDSATTHIQSWAPLSAGGAETHVVSGLSNATRYWFAVKAYDEVPNYGEISDSPSAVTVDAFPPAAIIDLATSSPTGTAITLTWTAPGDNGTLGTTTGYILKYSASGPLTASNWDSATTYTQSWTPLTAGNTETHVISGLDSGTEYWFALVAYDEVPNYGSISNSPNATTLPDTTPPATITDLAIVTGSLTNISVTLTWTAPGDDGMNGSAEGYLVKYSTAGPITASNWALATNYTQSWTPAKNGTAEIYIVTGLNPSTQYWFALEAYDEVSNCGLISNSPNGTTTWTSRGNEPPVFIVSLVASVVVLVSLVALVYMRRRRVPIGVSSVKTRLTVSGEGIAETEETLLVAVRALSGAGVIEFDEIRGPHLQTILDKGSRFIKSLSYKRICFEYHGSPPSLVQQGGDGNEETVILSTYRRKDEGDTSGQVNGTGRRKGTVKSTLVLCTEKPEAKEQVRRLAEGLVKLRSYEKIKEKLALMEADDKDVGRRQKQYGRVHLFTPKRARS